MLATEDDLVQLGFKMAERRLLQAWIWSQSPTSIVHSPAATPGSATSQHSPSIVESPLSADIPSGDSRPSTASRSLFKVSHLL